MGTTESSKVGVAVLCCAVLCQSQAAELSELGLTKSHRFFQRLCGLPRAGVVAKRGTGDIYLEWAACDGVDLA
jgi:hypothetical protein